MSNAVRDVLLVAFHFPPVSGSSGIQRTLRFAQHLPKMGWRPSVLTIGESAYEATSQSAGNEIPDGLEVHRAFGLDAARQLAIGGRYWRRLAIPDRWVSWYPWAVRRALRVIRTKDVRAIWSTFPIPTAHMIGGELARQTGLPWVAEFRDPMWQGDVYPPQKDVNESWLRLEQQVFARAQRIIVTTPGAKRLYATRYGAPDRLTVIENGYDEETFQRLFAGGHVEASQKSSSDRPLTLLHSGIIYPVERNPTHLFKAIASLKSNGRMGPGDLKIILRASGHDERYRPQIERLGIGDMVDLAPPSSYLQALEEMVGADGLLLLQASNCNEQVPAKLYEYVRAQRPIVALTDPSGDTAALLKRTGGCLISQLDDEDGIRELLMQFIAETRAGTLAKPDEQFARSCSRENRARELASVLEEVTRAG